MEYPLSKSLVIAAVVFLASLAALTMYSMSQAPTSIRDSTTADKVTLLAESLDTLTRGAQSVIISFSRRIIGVYTLPEQPLVVELVLPGGGEVIINGTMRTLVFEGLPSTVEGSMLKYRGTSCEVLAENDSLYVAPLPSTSHQCSPLFNGAMLHKIQVHYLKFNGSCSSPSKVIFKSVKLLEYRAVRIVPQDGLAALLVNKLAIYEFNVSRGDLVVMELEEQVINVESG